MASGGDNEVVIVALPAPQRRATGAIGLIFLAVLVPGLVMMWPQPIAVIPMALVAACGAWLIWHGMHESFTISDRYLIIRNGARTWRFPLAEVVDIHNEEEGPDPRRYFGKGIAFLDLLEKASFRGLHVTTRDRSVRVKVADHLSPEDRVDIAVWTWRELNRRLGDAVHSA